MNYLLMVSENTWGRSVRAIHQSWTERPLCGLYDRQPTPALPGGGGDFGHAHARGWRSVTPGATTRCNRSRNAHRSGGHHGAGPV